MPLDIAKYDARHYETLSVTDGYARWSRTYDDQLDDRLEIALLERIASVDWRSVRTALDLGCGTGRIGQWLKQRGIAAVDGVDLCAQMLALADAKDIYRTLLCQDMCATSLPGSCAGLVVSCLAIGHVADLALAYQEIHRLLEPGGCAVLVGYHPFFLLSGIPTHFKDADGSNRSIQNYIHLISDHISVALSLSFSLLEMHERIIDDEWVRASPGYAAHHGKPVSFAMVWRKPAAAPR